MEWIITIDNCGVSIRHNQTLRSYSFHNFTTPKGRDAFEYQKERWVIFLRRCSKWMTKMTIIKKTKVVYTKGRR